MTEYIIIFKGDSFDPIHAMSFDAAINRVEEWIENGAEIHYALEIEFLAPDVPRGFVFTEQLKTALYDRELDRQAAAAKAYVETGAGDYKRDLMKAE